MDPLDSVRTSCREVCAVAEHVAIENGAIETQAEELLRKTTTSKFADEVAWDASGWHYNNDVNTLGPNTVQYIFVMDALNFCFWPSPSSFEYEDLASSLRDVLDRDSSAFSADNLASISVAALIEWFPKNNIPSVEERVKRLQELGVVLRDGISNLSFSFSWKKRIVILFTFVSSIFRV